MLRLPSPYLNSIVLHTFCSRPFSFFASLRFSVIATPTTLRFSRISGLLFCPPITHAPNPCWCPRPPSCGATALSFGYKLASLQPHLVFLCHAFPTPIFLRFPCSFFRYFFACRCCRLLDAFSLVYHLPILLNSRLFSPSSPQHFLLFLPLGLAPSALPLHLAVGSSPSIALAILLDFSRFSL